MGGSQETEPTNKGMFPWQYTYYDITILTSSLFVLSCYDIIITSSLFVLSFYDIIMTSSLFVLSFYDIIITFVLGMYVYRNSWMISRPSG